MNLEGNPGRWVIAEKCRDWNDIDGDIESRFDKDTFLTIVMLYWITGSIGSSFRSYYNDRVVSPLPIITVPTGISPTPEDAGYPREYAERTYSDIRQWRELRRGGHFLALEVPEVLVRDLPDFFRPLRVERG
jgi:pimeloyl-ACP methyl ester carboxylesterase